ncbi:MAG: thymidine phosphorylase [Actinomycetota bacterium]
MDLIDVIRTKRDGARLSDEQIDWFIDSCTNGNVPDEQAAALLMAIVWHGMEPDELARWTKAMIDSGERVDLSSIVAPTVDKHSTGGVGDKVSLVLAPMIAACGAADPMMSGRGLGHTGGTLDKLETIPGFRVELARDEMLKVLDDVGCVIYAAGGDIAPADRKLYALRDVTGTVESIPLIASSIMSKKIAEGTSALVLDVKVGSGAFLPEIDQARSLAETMVALGESHGVKTAAVLTAMDAPLGRAAGNALEVVEAVAALNGRGPDDLMEVTVVLAEEMLDLVGLAPDPRATIADGSALQKWNAMVRAQGGDPDATLPEAPERRAFGASASGYLARLDARAVGVAAWRLGAGRAKKEGPVSAGAGVVCLKKPGDRVESGEPVLELHADDPTRFEPAIAALDGAIEIAGDPADARPLILDRIRP